MLSKHFQICAVANGPFEVQPITEELYNRIKEEDSEHFDHIGQGLIGNLEVDYYVYCGDLINITLPMPVTADLLLEYSDNIETLFDY